MQYEITKKFGEQVDKCQNKNILNRLFVTIQNIDKANNLSEIKNIKKLKGGKNDYRIRIGDYRYFLRRRQNYISCI